MPITNHNVFFQAGSFVLNPYGIDATTHEIRTGDTDAKAFLELVYNNRWAWDSERFQQEETRQGWLFGRQFADNRWAGFFGTGYDFQGRLSYTFTGDENSKASTIVGSGDVAAEFTVAKHLWRHHFDDRAQSLNLELSYGAVSDRNVFDVHHRGFVGLGYVGRMPERLLDNGRPVQYAIRLGAALIEHVSFTNSLDRVIEFKHDAPDFHHDLGLGLESEVYYPITKNTFLTAGGRLYSNEGPNVWSLWIGWTVPLSQFEKLK